MVDVRDDGNIPDLHSLETYLARGYRDKQHSWHTDHPLPDRDAAHTVLPKLIPNRARYRMDQHDTPEEPKVYPTGRGYGADYMRGGEVFGGYGYSARDEYQRPRGEGNVTADGIPPATDEGRSSA
ncbi:MAG: hypothetical protein NVS1B4_17530 [Gemmatimonadaceae bacterium]